MPDESVRRFAEAFQRLTQAHADDRIGVAVSGGPDSLALLLLSSAACPGRVIAATVDHGLRAESTSEASFVSGICAARSIPHETLTLNRLPRGNVSARARDARYRALSAWMARHSLKWLLTGHHADDQAETVFMRLNRGAGVGGVAGIRRRDGHIVRPLLDWRRSELVALVQSQGILAVDDPSNRDDRYDRARLRKALADADWIDPVALAHSAAALDDADIALEWSTAQTARDRITTQNGIVTLNVAGLPSEIVRRLAIVCLRKIRPEAVCNGPQVTRLLAVLNTGGKATLDGVACDARTNRGWVFAAAPPRRPTT